MPLLLADCLPAPPVFRLDKTPERARLAARPLLAAWCGGMAGRPSMTRTEPRCG